MTTLPTNIPTKYQLPKPYGFLRNSLENSLKVKVTTARSEAKSMSHHNNAHPQPQTNVPTMYQVPPPYGFQDIA